MAKATSKSSNKTAAFVLEFLGSLIYLILVFGTGNALAQGGGVWLPVLWGMAVISAISLFFLSFTNLTGMENWGAMKFSFMGGFALIALVGTSPGLGTASTLYWAAVLGFVLSFLGSGMAWKK